MGLMELPRTEPGQLLITPHPMLLDGQRSVVWEARAGESLYALLMRNVPELDGQAWAVCIGGVPVDRHLWHHVRPKAGQVIEVRGGVGKAALAIVAMVALTYFTMGAGAAWIGGAFGVAAGGLAAASIGAGLFMAGSMLINKVLAPKPAKLANQQQDSVFSISGARNQLRPYDPLPMLFGRVRIAPDLLSKPYTWYEGNDQYLGLLLCAGINVGRIEELHNGDTLLSSYEGVQVSHAGYSQMPEQPIPLYSNADTIDGAELEDTGAWVERTTSADTVRIQINLEYVLGGTGTSGKSYFVSETVEAQYRVSGATNWMPLASQTFRSEKFDVRRATLGRDVERGQYDVRVRMLGQGNYSGKNTQKNDFQWTTLTSVQADEADYTGLSRTGVRMKATGQLSGTPDELRAVGYADPIPVWNGTSWETVESSNPGAQILAYARGIRRSGRLLGGMALADAQIDIASLQAFMLHCAANGYSYDHYIKDARNHEQVLSAIALAGFGQITWAGGRLGVVWAAQEQPLSGVVNMATIKKGAFQVDYSLSNAADGIEYSYFDAATWETKTLRVPAPGVTTMLNPAQVSGEGVTTEAHAARLARWHLAQSLYQYKDISYSTDIEHLSYQRLSLLALQHDMTQWGYGGRVHAAVNASGTVTLTLDEPVPAPASGNAYIGLRIPGERVYRVLRVKPFAGESRTVELADAWPADAALPGGTASNPAHDTLWIYDFKQTPGLRVRVTSIEPESDLKGASVRVVAEGPEFWNYVLTGAYIPPPSGSLLPTKPVASNLRITEQQVVQGNTTFTELTATFDVTGPAGNIVVSAAGAAGGGILSEVAQTRTRTATWRIPRADSYTVVVRPFAEDGTAGVAVTGTYITAGADVPPVLVDLFDVQERSGGVRLYTWGWLADTMQSPDFAGVEIRYTAGDVPAPDWDAMTPVGDSGFFTAAFEAVVPDAGQWTFACRSRNSSGVLSNGMQVITRTLGKSLGQSLADITAEQVAQQQAIDQAVADALAADLKAAKALVLMGEEYDPASTYIAGDVVYFNGRMYRANAAVPMDTPPPAAQWDDVGTVTQAQAGTASAINQLRVDVDDQGQQFAASISQVESGLSNVTESIKAFGGGGNLVVDASMTNDVSSWGYRYGQPASVGIFSNAQDVGIAIGSRGLVIRLLDDGEHRVGSSPIAIGPDTDYIFSAYGSGHPVQLFVLFYGVGGNWITEIGSGDIAVGVGGPLLSDHTRISLRFRSPPGTATCRIAFRIVGEAGKFGRFLRPMLEQSSVAQTLPSPWSLGGSESAASHTVSLDVNGYVSGTQSMNDGKRSSFNVLASVFRVISNIVGAGMEWQDGYLRMWRGSAQLVMGHTFGSGNLIFWYGPNVGAANCTKGNATIWFDTSGGAYFGGSLSAGVLKNAAQSTEISPVASVAIGPFGTNGRAKVINWGVSFSNSGFETSNIGNATLTGTVVLERSLNAGANWVQISSLPVTGDRTSAYDGELGRWNVDMIASASGTFTDNTAGTQDFMYRVRVTAANGWPLIINNGAAPASYGIQRTYVQSIEQ